MSWRDVVFRVRALLRRSRMDDELREEMDFHLDMEARRNEARGMDPGAARRAAALAFGGRDRFEERTRTAWGVEPVMQFISDVRYAVRQLRRNPGFATASMATLALGLGGTIALSGVLYSLMLRPLPVADEDRVVVFWDEYSWRGIEFDLLDDVPHRFESVAAFTRDAVTLQRERDTQMIPSVLASAELFGLLGVQPALGRGFLPGDDRPGAEPVVVLSHTLWQREFSADPTIVGRVVQVDGQSRTVVGVMPESFFFPSPEVEAFLPLDLDPASGSYQNNGWLILVARTSPAQDPGALDQDLAVIATALGERFDYPAAWDKTRSPSAQPLRSYLLGDVRPAVLLLLAASALLLLMACANVGALVLGRTLDRAGELAVRTALGAGTLRIVRQLTTEALVLGLVSGVLALGLASLLFDVLVASLPMDPAFQTTVRLDGWTWAAALGLSVAAALLIALTSSRHVLTAKVRNRTLRVRSGSSAGRGLQQALVFAELCLAVVLITGASLLVRTVGALRAVDVGFEPAGVATVGMVLPSEGMPEEERANAFDAVLTRVAALPGVQSAGLMNRLPLRDGGYQGPLSFPDRPDLDGDARPGALFRPVTPDLFSTLGLEVVRGRGIQASDGVGAPPVVVVNESLPRRIWGDDDPLGRRFNTGFVGDVEVVGVARDAALTELGAEAPAVGFYSWDQAHRGTTYGILVARTDGDPDALLPMLRSAIAEVAPRVAIARAQTMPAVMDAEIVEPLRLRFFLSLFGALGLALGAVGVYGVVAYAVHRRRSEFGIRMALGAAPARLLRDVTVQSLTPVLLGVGVGVIVSLALSRLVRGFLFGVEPADPASLAFAASVLLLVGSLATGVAALRATRTQPASVLRSDG